MKLYKRVAACLLTAVIVISTMLTVCGDGSNPDIPDDPDSNTPSTLPKPDEIVLPDIDGSEGGDEGTETKPTKTPIADVNNSKLAQFNNKYASATEFYAEMQLVFYDEDGSTRLSNDLRTARKGESFYLSSTALGKNQKQWALELLRLKNKSTWDQYRLLRSSKVAFKTGSLDDDEVDMSLNSSIELERELPAQMWSTKVKVGPTEYYAEVYHSNSIEHTICYTADGKPVYHFKRDLSNGKLVAAWLYKTIQVGSGTSKGLCELPSDFKTYSYDEKKEQFIDANGNKFPVERQFNSEGKRTGFKVYDKNNKDVTADFEWLPDVLVLTP